MRPSGITRSWLTYGIHARAFVVLALIKAHNHLRSLPNTAVAGDRSALGLGISRGSAFENADFRRQRFEIEVVARFVDGSRCYFKTPHRWRVQFDCRLPKSEAAVNKGS